MATPSKLSWSRRKEARAKASTVPLVSDEDDEKENSGALDSSMDNKSLERRSRVVKGRRRESTILAGNLSYQVASAGHLITFFFKFVAFPLQESVVSATSAEISVIRRPQVTRCPQDVLIEEEEDEDGGGDQSSFQSCTSSLPMAQVPQIQLDMDSRLTEVEEHDYGNSLGSRVDAASGLQSKREKGINTPSQKCPQVTGLGLCCVLVYFPSRRVGCLLQITLINNDFKS